MVAPQEAFSTSCCAARISASRGLRNLDHAKSRYSRHISYLKGCDAFKCGGVSQASPVLPLSCAMEIWNHSMNGSSFTGASHLRYSRLCPLGFQQPNSLSIRLVTQADTAELTEDSAADEALRFQVVSPLSCTYILIIVFGILTRIFPPRARYRFLRSCATPVFLRLFTCFVSTTHIISLCF
jgi:hypothetical protein